MLRNKLSEAGANTPLLAAGKFMKGGRWFVEYKGVVDLRFVPEGISREQRWRIAEDAPLLSRRVSGTRGK